MSMELNFKISEFNITGKPIPEDIADAILKHHILPMQPIRSAIGIPINVSLNSGYRPLWHEIKMGRSGKSQHVFANGKGATDWTCDNLDLLEELMVKQSPYTRICRYTTFIHADYKDTNGERQHFKNGKDGWEFQGFIGL